MSKRTHADRTIISGAPQPNHSRDVFHAAAAQFGTTATEIERAVRGKEHSLGRGLATKVQDFVTRMNKGAASTPAVFN